MNVLDIIYFAVTVCALFGGYKAGFLSKVSFPLGILFGIFNASVLFTDTSELLKNYLDWDETAISVTAFIVIMVLSVIAISLAISIICWLLNIFNRIAGALLSAFLALLIVTAIVDLTSLVAPDNKITGKTTQEQSVLYNKVVNDIYKKTITRLF